MNIFQNIDNANSDKKYSTINSMQHMKELTSREYDFLYRELKYKGSFHYVDCDFEYNLVMKIDNEKQIEEVVKNRKAVNVTRNSDGPVIEMNIEGLTKPFSFMFDLGNNESLYKLKILKTKKEAKMHFVLYDSGKLTKIFSAMLNIDQRISQRLDYIIKLTYDGCYPYSDYFEESYENIKCIETDGNESILEEIVNVVDNLQKWGSSDSFSVLVELREIYRVTFKGRINNFNYIKSELQKKIRIFGETQSDSKGIPFIKYDSGMIYFYKTRFSDNNE